jgi:hypothetical protein
MYTYVHPPFIKNSIKGGIREYKYGITTTWLAARPASTSVWQDTSQASTFAPIEPLLPSPNL